jgi:hypothetical protein
MRREKRQIKQVLRPQCAGSMKKLATSRASYPQASPLKTRPSYNVFRVSLSLEFRLQWGGRESRLMSDWIDDLKAREDKHAENERVASQVKIRRDAVISQKAADFWKDFLAVLHEYCDKLEATFPDTPARHCQIDARDSQLTIRCKGFPGRAVQMTANFTTHEIRTSVSPERDTFGADRFGKPTVFRFGLDDHEDIVVDGKLAAPLAEHYVKLTIKPGLASS